MRGTDMRQTIGLMAACAALLASCTNEVGEGLGIDTPIQVTASVEGIMTTRAENTTKSLKEFGLSIKDGEGYTGNYAGENIKVTGNNTDGWIFSDNKTVLYKGSGQTYYAYAPYVEGHTGESLTFTVDKDQATNGLQGSDLLHASGTVGSANLSVTFSHKLSKLTVTLQKEENLTENVTFNAVTLQGTKLGTTLNLTNGAVSTATGTAADITMCPTGTNNAYECILVPQTATYSVLINATVGSEQKTYVYTPSAAYTFESDRSYTLALKVKKTDEPTAIESIDVKGWGDGNAIALGNGEADELDYTIDAEGHYTVRTAEGLLKWREAVGSNNGTTNCTLAADIDMTEETWRGANIFYYGTFDGNGHTITGLKGDCFTYRNVGTIKNLTLIEPNISPSSNIGTVAFYNNGTIENCHVVGGSVEGTGEGCGGIVGFNERGTIRACSSSAAVSSNNANTYVGGIAGFNMGSGITACYATGSVTGSDGYTGAIAGNNELGPITACYWSGNAEKGVGRDPLGYSEVEKVEGDVSWTDAAEAMNAALKTAGISYRWVANGGTDAATRPLVITTE